MGETIPPVSKSQPALERDDDPHESVTIAPPAPNFDELLRQVGPGPSLTNRSDHHFRAALEAGARTGSNLGDLAKMLSELSSGVVSARQANEQLVEELSTLRSMLGLANETQADLRYRLAEVEQMLVASQADAERERLFLTEQHDEFLSALLDEHEDQLLALTGEGDSKLQEALIKAETQRDDALARANRLERERDELRAEGSMLRARLGMLRSASTTPPPPVVSSRPPSYRPAKALQLDAGELDSTLRPSPSRLPKLSGRPASPPPASRSLSSPPPELEGAIYTPGPPSVGPPSSDGSASAFPRVSTRPGVGGPKPSEPPPPPSFGPSPSGWTPTPPPATATPVVNVPERPRVVSVASMPPSQPGTRPLIKQKPDPTTRPLIGYSLQASIDTETLEGARLSSKPPRK